ncbi:MAG TPA: helix-turn-helix domain-containing protein, partial [Lachnospiraceae bacterium]|nr:helix-turn-helix domain-containing protein [Lachnospiraceae bacterium]
MSLNIGETICRLRKERLLTQEQLASAIGVSAPAVSKWEKNSSYPDITLLAPLARVLGVTIDYLLSFQIDLTEEEVKGLEKSLQEKFDQEGFEVGMNACESMLKEYPTSMFLKFRIVAVIQMNSMYLTDEGKRNECVKRIIELSEEILRCDDSNLVLNAKILLSSYYMMQEDYTKAEDMLNQIPDPQFDKASLYPVLYLRQGEYEKAKAMYEKELFRNLSASLIGIRGLSSIAKRREDYEKALELTKVYEEVIDLFQMKHVYRDEQKLSIYLAMKDKDKALESLERYIRSSKEINLDYSDNPYFSSGVSLKNDNMQVDRLRGLLLLALQNDEEFELIRGEERFEELCKELEE